MGIAEHPHAENYDHPFRGPYMGDNRYSVYRDVKNRTRMVKDFSVEECGRALELDDLQKTVEAAIKRRIRKLGR